MNVQDFLIINNKDNLSDDYRIESGKFFSDHAVVSSVALSCDTDPLAFYYVSIPSNGDFHLKYEVQGRITPPTVSYKSKPVSDVFPLNNCALIDLDVFHGNLSGDYYVTGTADSKVGFFGSCWGIANPNVIGTTDVVGGRSSAEEGVSAVSPCLILPTHNGSSLKTFNTFTLSGGVEVPRFTLFMPPTALITVTLSSQSDGSFASNDLLINYYENSSIITNTNTEVDNWYVDVSGFMWPDQYLYNHWNVRWAVQDSGGEETTLSAHYINRSTGDLGSVYDGLSYQVDANPLASNEQIDYVRFYFKNPGVKVVDFLITNGDPNIEDDEIFYSHSVNTVSFGNQSDLEVLYVSAENTPIPNSISLSAITSYNQGGNRLNLDSSYPQIKWYWENSTGGGEGLTAESIKTASPITTGVAVDAVDADFVKFSATTSDFYNISVVNTVSNALDTYLWSNFTPTTINLEYEFDNCPIGRSVSISAMTDSGGEDVLYDGTDYNGNPVVLMWSWDTNNVNARSDSQTVQSNIISLAKYVNPITVTFNDTPSVSRTLLSTNFSVSSNIISPPDNEDSITLEYDVLPKGFELDVEINYETSSEIGDAFYRISEGVDFTANFKGKIKPDDDTGWLTDGEIAELQLTQPSKIFWYFNDDNTNLNFGNDLQNVFPLVTDNYHISSITFAVSCLSASPNFGYGHSLSKTVELGIYKDSFIPDVNSIVFPEYQFRLPNTPSIRGLGVNPNEYWLDTPYPSAYGEGRTDLFLASAFSDDYSGPSWSNFYDSSLWYVDGLLDQQPIGENSFLQFNVPTNIGEEQSVQGVVGAFNNSINLLNQTLSTYKNDVDGTTEVFKNWKVFDEPILITNYESSSSQEITVSRSVPNVSTLIINFNLLFNYPDFSPVRENSNFREVEWTIISDTGVDFSGSSPSDTNFLVQLTPQTNIRALFVSAEVITKEYIPNQSSFTLNYPFKDVEYSIPEVEVDVAFNDFTLSASESYDVIDNLSNTITAFAPVDLEGIIFSQSESYSYEWNVDGKLLGTDTPFLTTIDGYSMIPSEDSYLGPIIPITLTLDDGGPIVSKSKFLHVNPSFNLDWRVFANNSIIKVGQETFFQIDTEGPIPLSSFTYRFDGDTEEYTIDYGEVLYKSFDTSGSKNMFLSAIDVKGYLYETTINDVVTVVDEYAGYLEDQFVGDEIDIKVNYDTLKIQPNEFAVNSVINESFTSLYDNLIFLENISKFYSKPPFKFLGWFGAYDSNFQWNLNPFDLNYNFVSLEDQTPTNLISYRVINSENILLAYSDKIEIRENNYTSQLVGTINERSINDNFVDIKNAVTDSDGNIIILDAVNFGLVSIYQYNPRIRNPFKFIASWGGLGGEDSKSKFNGANDITIDSNDRLFVADTGNRVIKKFTNTGGFLGKMVSDKFNPSDSSDVGTVGNGSVISVSNGNDDVVYALTDNYVVLFDNLTNKELSSFDWTTLVSGLTPVKITAGQDDSILYIVFEEKVGKFTKDGLLIGFIGETPEEFETDIPSFKYTNYFHYSDRTGYLISSRFVVKYSDVLSFLFIKPDIADDWWQLSNLHINKDEFVEYWVYNKSFSRFWDNFELFRTSLLGRVLFSFDENGKVLFNIYKRDSIYRPEFTYSKNDILIGVNELVTTEVVNRSLFRLQSCALELLEMITSQEVRYRWVDTISVGGYPTKWSDTKSDSTPLRWGDAVS